ncbi:hypothetical protein HHI36_017264 [Cryptolaemus montrouzieri]|uniref:Uncharacterized protein n=1 Tax=Cryptolaemus montrouzieri TaxID=559131 RepID=A0ABD2NLZ7_9CUCU
MPGISICNPCKYMGSCVKSSTNKRETYVSPEKDVSKRLKRIQRSSSVTVAFLKIPNRRCTTGFWKSWESFSSSKKKKVVKFSKTSEHFDCGHYGHSSSLENSDACKGPSLRTNLSYTQTSNSSDELSTNKSMEAGFQNRDSNLIDLPIYKDKPNLHTIEYQGNSISNDVSNLSIDLNNINKYFEQLSYLETEFQKQVNTSHQESKNRKCGKEYSRNKSIIESQTGKNQQMKRSEDRKNDEISRNSHLRDEPSTSGTNSIIINRRDNINTFESLNSRIPKASASLKNSSETPELKTIGESNHSENAIEEFSSENCAKNIFNVDESNIQMPELQIGAVPTINNNISPIPSVSSVGAEINNEKNSSNGKFLKSFL